MLDTHTPYLQPDWIFADFRALGVQAYRQLTMADRWWGIIQPGPGAWNFAQADAVVPNADFEPIVTLFGLQYASPTCLGRPPPTVSSARSDPKRAYLEAVIERYGPYVRYWEIGNEMDHWRAAGPGSDRRPRISRPRPRDGFSPWLAFGRQLNCRPNA